jgi:hypothetical protein
MWMSSKAQFRLAALAVAGAAALFAQDTPLPSGSITINLPKDSPVLISMMSPDQSRASARGGALILDLHMSLSLRNVSTNRIHGVTLRVFSQEGVAGGKGSVTYPSLNIGPGEDFPVRIESQLVRPAQVAMGSLVQVELDGVLFQDLSFYGPDRLHSRRILTAHEMEAQRDREYFKRVLAQSGKEGLKQAIYQSLDRQSKLAPLNARVVRSGPAVSSAALPPEHPTKFAFVQLPGAPIEAVEGWAQVSGNEARAPRIEVVNKSNKPVKYVELGWILSDQSGRQSLAASLPSADGTLLLPAGKTASVQHDSSLKLFTGAGQPVSVSSMTGFINQVEFADGQVWVPDRRLLDDASAVRAVAPSAEEMRLTNVFRKNGIDRLVDELKKF